MKAERTLLTLLGVLLTLTGAIVITVTAFEWRGILGWISIVGGIVVLAIAVTRASARSHR